MSKLTQIRSQQRARIQELGLMRNAQHTLHQKKRIRVKNGEEIEVLVWAPITINSRTEHGPRPRRIIAETIVFLYNTDEWRQVIKDKKKDDDPFPTDVLKPVGIGIALCSEKDQYSRKVGLTIATQRALARYEKTVCKRCKGTRIIMVETSPGNVVQDMCPDCEPTPEA